MIGVLKWGIPRIAGAAIALFPIQSASADTPAFEYTNSRTLTDTRPFTLGFQFTLSAPTTVDALGYWSGNLTSQSVGLWDNSGNLLTSATVNSGDPVTGHYNYASITPLTLGAGTYVLGGSYSGGLFPTQLMGVVTAPQYAWNQDRYAFGTGLNFPGQTTNGSYGQNGIAEVNFLISGVSGVPEPSSWAIMLLGFGILGLRIRRNGQSGLAKLRTA